MLNLRAGELVEVRDREDILHTLDSSGKLDNLPFMPEMAQYCGRQFRVYKRADKACDTVHKTGTRRMFGTVHLEGLRCDGQAHGGCQALCLLFWKEAWLKRPTKQAAVPSRARAGSKACTVEALQQAASTVDPSGEGGTRYMCQATELPKATTYMAWWDVRQYLRDVSSGNVGLVDLLRGIAIGLFNTVQRRRGRKTYPYIAGALTVTPKMELHLRPGETVRIKSKDEILQTLNDRRRNRGLLFDPEMVKYCGGRFTVLSRPERIIEEKTGRMMTLANDCIILDKVTCVGDLSTNPNRLFCPRNIYPYWREIWLERAD